MGVISCRRGEDLIDPKLHTWYELSRGFLSQVRYLLAGRVTYLTRPDPNREILKNSTPRTDITI